MAVSQFCQQPTPSLTVRLSLHFSATTVGNFKRSAQANKL